MKKNLNFSLIKFSIIQNNIIIIIFYWLQIILITINTNLQNHLKFYAYQYQK